MVEIERREVVNLVLNRRRQVCYRFDWLFGVLFLDDYHDLLHHLVPRIVPSVINSILLNKSSRLKRRMWGRIYVPSHTWEP